MVKFPGERNIKTDLGKPHIEVTCEWTVAKGTGKTFAFLVQKLMLKVLSIGFLCTTYKEILKDIIALAD